MGCSTDFAKKLQHSDINIPLLTSKVEKRRTKVRGQKCGFKLSIGKEVMKGRSINRTKPFLSDQTARSVRGATLSSPQRYSDSTKERAHS